MSFMSMKTPPALWVSKTKSLYIYFFSTDDDDVLLLTMSQMNRFTFRDLGFLMNVVPRATLTICTTHWVSYIHIVEVFVQVQKCLTLLYVSCAHLSFRRGRQPMVRHRSLHPTSSFQADENCHFLAAHSAEAWQEQCFFHLGFKSRTCGIRVSASRPVFVLFSVVK